MLPAATEPTAGVAESEKSSKKILSGSETVWLLAVPVTEKLVGFELLAESPVTVTVLVSPGVMEVGLKEHVTPLEQASEMLEVKLDTSAVAATVKLVLVLPTRMVEELAVDESVNSEPPLPVRETDALPEAFEVTENVPVWAPPEVGAKKMLAWQLAPAFSTTGTDKVTLLFATPQLLTSVNWELMLNSVIETEALLVLTISTVWNELVCPTARVGKVNDEGIIVRPALAVPPEPVRVM